MPFPKRKAAATPDAAGFTLLETLVALAILAAALVPIIRAVTNDAGNLSRLGGADRRAEAALAALGAIESINPMLQPDGLIEAGALQLRWTSAPSAPVRPTANFPSGPGLFDIGLYAVTVNISGPGLPPFSVEIQQIGYRRRDAPPPF